MADPTSNTTSSAQTAITEWDRNLVTQFSSLPARVVADSYERSVVTLDELALRAINFANSSSEKARRSLADRRRLIVKDAWGQLLRSDILNWVKPVTASAVMGDNHNQVDISRNPARDIWKELAVLYKQPAVRRTMRDQKSAELYAQLVKGTGFETFWQQVDEALEVYNDLILYPAVIEREGKKFLKHRWAAGNTASVLLDDEDPTKIFALVLIDNYVDIDGNDAIKYIFWSDHWHAVYDDELKRLDVGENPGINPYGELPFVPVHRYPTDVEFWDQTTGEDLINLTLNIGKQRTFTNYEWKMSSFKQMVVTGQIIDSAPEQLRDPAAVLHIQTDGSTQVVDWSPNFTMRQQYIDADIAHAAATRGINPERLKRGGNYQTGLGAKVADRGLIERRQAKAALLQAAEADYYRKVCILARVHGLDFLPDENDLLEVDHAPLEYPEDPKALLDYTEQAIKLGAQSSVELIRRQHPTWSTEQCLKFLEDNLAITAKVMEWRARYNIPSNLSTESATAEQNGRLGPMIRDNSLSGSAPVKTP